MKIFFSPVRNNEILAVSMSGETLTINQTDYDFSKVQSGSPLLLKDIKSRWICSDVVRKDGVLNMTLILPHGANPPHETLFPEPIVVENDGPITLPKANLPEPVEINDD